MYPLPRDLSQVLTLATRRYPRTHALLALQYFESDRRTAGLGALKDSPGRGHKNVRNIKRVDLETLGVFYHRIIDIPQRWELPPMEFTFSITDVSQNECVTMLKTPARFVERYVRVSRRDFQTQEGRNRVANYLRQLRRETRQA